MVFDEETQIPAAEMKDWFANPCDLIKSWIEVQVKTFMVQR